MFYVNTFVHKNAIVYDAYANTTHTTKNTRPRKEDIDLVRTISKKLASGQCPQGTKIDLTDVHIGEKGARLLAGALKSGNCPQGLKINFTGNRLGNEGIKAITTALKKAISNKSLPYGVRINGVGNNPGDISGMLETYDATLLESNVKIIASPGVRETTGFCPEICQVIASYIKPSLAVPATFFNLVDPSQKIENKGKEEQAKDSKNGSLNFGKEDWAPRCILM